MVYMPVGIQLLGVTNVGDIGTHRIMFSLPPFKWLSHSLGMVKVCFEVFNPLSTWNGCLVLLEVWVCFSSSCIQRDRSGVSEMLTEDLFDDAIILSQHINSLAIETRRIFVSTSEASGIVQQWMSVWELKVCHSLIEVTIHQISGNSPSHIK